VNSYTYTDKGTAIQKQSPLAKLAWGLAILVLSLLFDHPCYLALLMIISIVVVGAAKVFKQWASAMKFGVWLSVSIIVINGLVSFQGSHMLLEAPFNIPTLGTPGISLEALVFGAVMALKLLVIISVFTLLNQAVHPDDIMAAMLKLKFPYKSVLVTTLTTRFVPCLIDDVSRISDGYRARGLQLDEGNFIRRLRNRGAITIPLLCNSLDRASQVAEAMEARGFGSGRKRSRYKNLSVTLPDALAITAALISLALGIYLRIAGFGGYGFYPSLDAISANSISLYLIGITILLLALVPLAYLKRKMDLD